MVIPEWNRNWRKWCLIKKQVDGFDFGPQDWNKYWTASGVLVAKTHFIVKFRLNEKPIRNGNTDALGDGDLLDVYRKAIWSEYPKGCRC